MSSSLLSQVCLMQNCCVLNHMAIHINLKTHNYKNAGNETFKKIIGKYHSKTVFKTKDELCITYRL